MQGGYHKKSKIKSVFQYFVHRKKQVVSLFRGGILLAAHEIKQGMHQYATGNFQTFPDLLHKSNL